MTTRNGAIDFWRGVALAIILINHIPGNFLGNFTPRNFGFSDSAEAFVFISGLSVSFAYGERFRSGSFTLAAASMARRAIRLYGVHLALTASALLLFGAARYLTGNDALLADLGRGTPFADPLRGALGILSLSHQIGYFNILPIYVLFMILAPALFFVGVRNRWRMLAFSATLYALTRAFGFNAPLWPEEGFWYFNPAAWQLMFALGMFVGLAGKEGGVPVNGAVYWCANAFTLVAAIVVSNGFGFFPGLVDSVGAHLDWDKTELGFVRILDFAALAYVIYCSNLTTRLRSTAIYPAVALLGRRPLPVFFTASLLSGLGQIVTETWPASPLFDVLFVATSLKSLHTVAALLERRSTAQFAIA